MEAEKVIMILIAVLGSLTGVIVYFYKRLEVEHERDITDYKERLAKRDARIKDLQSIIESMQTRLDQTYQRFIEKLNGKVSP